MPFRFKSGRWLSARILRAGTTFITKYKHLDLGSLDNCRLAVNPKVWWVFGGMKQNRKKWLEIKHIRCVSNKDLFRSKSKIDRMKNMWRKKKRHQITFVHNKKTTTSQHTRRKKRNQSAPYMQVTFEQGGVDDLQEFFAASNSWRSLHERRRCGRVGVVQLFHEVAAFLCGKIKKTRGFTPYLLILPRLGWASFKIRFF